MNSYTYTAKTSEGETVRSEVHAGSRHEALSVLRTSGLTLLNLSVVDPAASGPKPQARRAAAGTKGRRVSRVPLGDLAIFCRQLSISINAGVPLRDSLESIAEDVDHAGLRRTLRQVIERLYDGATFSEALAEQGKAFGQLFVALIRSAEEAGSMPETLDQMAYYLEKQERLLRKIRSITAYPLFVAGFFLLVCLVMTVAVLPRFTDIFAGFNARLPLITRFVFGSNRFLLDHFLWIAAGVLAVAGAGLLYSRTRAGQAFLDRLKLRMPVLGPCLRKLAVARFCRNLSIMVRGGVPITTAIEIASSVCGNRVLEKSLLQAKDRIISGSDISSSLGHDKEFPRLVVRMVGVGERSGQLPEVLDKVSDAYENQVEGAILVAMSMAEPVFICFFGVMILIMVLAIYMPIFSVSSSV